MRGRSRAIPGVALAAALALASCGGEKDPEGAGADEKAVQAAVRESLRAENEKDAEAFLALWTDKGLESYDVGSREDVRSGKSENFGSDRIEIVRFAETEAADDAGSATVDAVRGENQIAKPVLRVKFLLAKQGGKWLLDGFEFIGSPPPAGGAQVVAVRGVEYAFALDTEEASGNLAFRFANNGKEAHELTLFKGPDGVDLATAKKALENVDGRELKDIPAGYKADHLTFVEPGKSTDVTFADPLSKGTYVLACYIPQGGFGPGGEPVDPQGKAHIQLGMISLLTVK